MGMNAAYRAISGRAAEKLLAKPALTNAFETIRYSTAEDSTVPATWSQSKLIDLGVLRGYVTYDELNQCMPEDATFSEDIDAWLQALKSAGVDIVDAPPKGARAATLTQASKQLLAKHGLSPEDVEEEMSIG